MNPEELLEVVEAPPGAVVTASGELVHQCPYRDERDDGTIAVRWRTVSHTIELHSLATYLDAYEECSLSHEDLTDRITKDLSALGGIELLGVATSFETAGLGVQVRFDDGQ